MKVLHVNAGLETGGGLFHLINLLTEANKSGQDFTLLTFADGPVAKAAREKGITVEVFNQNSRFDPTTKNKLADFINEHNFDIVNSHGARANLFMNKIRHKISAKWIVTVHSDPNKDFAGRGIVGKIFTNLNLKSIKNADQLMAITENFKKILVNQDHIAPEKISVIYNGIFFHEQIPEKIAHQEFNIVNVARMEIGKGQDILLRSVAKLTNNHVKLNLIGSGSQEQNLRNLAKELKIEQQVIFHGFLNHDQITEIYRSMDLAALTSYSESFPLVLLEASDNLVPILSTDVGDIKKMIPNPEHGFVAEIGDEQSIVQQLNAAIQSPISELMQMAVLEKSYLEKNFSMNQQLASILKIYDRVLLK